MAHDRSRLNGTPPKGEWSIKAMRLGLTLSAALMLANCQTTASTGVKAKCAGLKGVSYDSTKDTPETVKQAKIHNAVLKKLGCL